MEECPQHIRLLVAEAGHNWPDFTSKDTSKLGECEFALISEMNSQLIVHHPYRSLSELQATFPLSQEENSLAWNIINDHYLTDLPLLYAPHVMAVTAIVLAVVLRPQQSTQIQAQHVASALQALSNPKAAPGATGPGGAGVQNRVQKLITWLAESTVDIEAVVDCTQELISLYELWDSQYNDKVCRDKINSFVKGRGLDR